MTGSHGAGRPRAVEPGREGRRDGTGAPGHGGARTGGQPADPYSPRRLPAREAYPLWAPHYDTETVISALDEWAVHRLSPRLERAALLDVGCGTGRRLNAAGSAQDPAGRESDEARAAWAGREPRGGAELGPALRVGVDLVPAMLRAGRSHRTDGVQLVAGDVRALPIASARFDLVWCRLVAGHVPELDALYEELARVARLGGSIIVTDFHPDAARAGHTRTFRDAEGRLHEIEHVIHDRGDHERAAAAARLSGSRTLHAHIGPEVRPFYEAAGALDRYEAQLGSAVVLGLRFRR